MAPDLHAPWRDHTAALLALAEARGLRTGLNIQLYGQSNLQRAFDLSDDDTGTVPLADELAARLPLVTDGVAFDVYDLSFGEFFSADPAAFVADMRALPFEAEFDAAINVYTAFGYFADEADDLETLRRVRRALVPGGRFLLETRGRATQLELLSPLGQTVASARLDDGGAELVTSEGRRYEAESPEQLTEKVLGWRVPIGDLPRWLRGGLQRPTESSSGRPSAGRWASNCAISASM